MEVARIFVRMNLVQALQWLLASLAAIAMLSGCTGSTGAAGATGPAGPTGPQGPSGATGTAPLATTAQTLTPTITSVTVGTPATPIVKFTVTNESGQPVRGLTKTQVRFIIAKLVPPNTQLNAVPPQTTAPPPQPSYQWQSYIYARASAASGTITSPVTGGTLPKASGGADQPQATTENGTGTFLDNTDGTYQYTFQKDISGDPAVTYDATLTHRVGMEIRGVTNSNTGNAVATKSTTYDFQPSTGGAPSTQNRIVTTATCMQCHQDFAFHGGARTNAEYCDTCHNPSSLDPTSGNSLDFKQMFHKLHLGAKLPSVAAGGGSYYIYSRFGVADYSANEFPTTASLETPTGDPGSPPTTCYTCHRESDSTTPETVNWRNNPSIEACGSCHDDVNFATGANHSNIGNVTNANCVECHGPTSTKTTGPAQTAWLLPQTSLKVDAVHTNFLKDYGKQFALALLNVDLSNLTAPKVTFKVTDPTNSSHTWNVLTDEPFTGAVCTAGVADLGIQFGWTTADYVNAGTDNTDRQPRRYGLLCGNNPAGLPVANGDGSFTSTLPAIPQSAVANYTGLNSGSNVGALLDGFPGHTFPGFGSLEVGHVPSVACGTAPATSELPPSGQPGSAISACGTVGSPTSGAAGSARREIVSVQKCDLCHDEISFHGAHRVESVQACTFCHNVDGTDYKARQAVTAANGGPITAANAPDLKDEQPINLMILVHAAHFKAYLNSQSGAKQSNPAGSLQNSYVLYHRGSLNSLDAPTPFSSVNGGATESNNCNACHGVNPATQLATYYLPDPSTVLPVTVNSNHDAASPAGKIAMTPGTAACSSCHITQQAELHMTSNGGSFTAVKDVNGRVPVTETCTICHGPGAIADVKAVHTGIH
jgi:OmcA/MtrC family decaheme c-type cytochrome